MGTNVIVALVVIYFTVKSTIGLEIKIANNGYVVNSERNSIPHLNADSLSNSVPNGECNLPRELTEEIANYKPIVEAIINATVNGIYKGRTWRTLAKFVDKFGSRIAGSDNLENAIDFMVDLLKKSKLDNVHTEPALVPRWVRGKETCWMVSPRLEKFNILGLGSSIGTPPKGISAHAVVVTSFEELQKMGKEVKVCQMCKISPIF